MDVQQLAFLYKKEEKDAAIFKLRKTITEDPDTVFDKQSIFRAAPVVVSVIIGVCQENGAYATVNNKNELRAARFSGTSFRT